jgi:outer membrane protein OmpA-like peptidoglycan-associated protein
MRLSKVFSSQSSEVPTSTDSSFSVSFDSIRYNSSDIFKFNFSESLPSIPEENQAVFQSISSHLLNSPDVTLTLTGLYSPDEQNMTTYPNLGIARAESIKTLLVEKGAPREQILTRYLNTNSSFQVDGKLMGSVYFSFTNDSEPQTGQAEAIAAEVAEPASTPGSHILRFPAGDSRLDKVYSGLLDTLRDELQADENRIILIQGYSLPDEERKTADNMAELRARAVRRYLVDHGVRRRQIEVKAHAGKARSSKERIVILEIKSS